MGHPTDLVKVNLTAEAAGKINRHAVEAFPFECCGFLYGNESKGRLITVAEPVVNSKKGDQRRRFEISPFDYMKAEQFALQNELQLLGIYHSHPNHPAIASKHDLEVAMPFFSYVIVSVLEGRVNDMKSWKLLEEKREFQEEEVSVVE